MGLIKSKSPTSGHAVSSDDSTQDEPLEHRRCHRRRLPPTPSPWTSSELVDSSPENHAEFISVLRSKWSEVVRHRSLGERRGMLRKLVGRLSQKIKPQVETTQPTAHTQVQGHCDHSTGASCFTAGPVTTSTYPDHNGNCESRPVSPQHRDPRTTLSIYRSTLHSCAETTLTSDHTNINCQKTVEVTYHTSNQVCIFVLRL